DRGLRGRTAPRAVCRCPSTSARADVLSPCPAGPAGPATQSARRYSASSGASVRITDTVVIGAGQAGLAASRCLTDHGRDHVVLERGQIGQRWRGDTWDSLHLLTPNWMNTLPGEAYCGPDPNGFSSASAFGEHLARY